ncbi:MAG TPA: PA14 domain-containing protein [Anaerolineae bacterium]|nr:PA14 domain-containing protein [Anaerolineae bacterium]HQI83767.1 PA14 domain-containing protein [Anaerolineae bacterium]
MRPRHTQKTASCLYMLGFLSGLVFVILCGSTTLYNNIAPSSSQVERNEQPVNIAPQEALPQQDGPTTDSVEILYGATTDGQEELTVNAFGFEPGTAVMVYLKDGNQVLDTKSDSADGMGAISVDFILPAAARTLTHVQVVVEYNGIQIAPTPYPLPRNGNVDTSVVDAALVDAAGKSVQTPQSVVDVSKSTPGTWRPVTVMGSTATAPTNPTAPTNTPFVTPTPPPLAPATVFVPPLMPAITATPLPTSIPMEPYYPNWRAEYYNNATWANAPAVVRDDQDIAFNWGESSPAPGAVGQNWFSARWTRRVVLPEGYYTFVLSADDQAEVYKDGEKFLTYMGKSPSVNQKSIYVQGFVPIEFEVKYIEYWGNAHVQFYWQPVGTGIGEEAGAGCCWTATYHQGAEIFGEPVWTQSIPGNDLRLEWNKMQDPIWQYVGYGNYFSARFTREIQAPQQAGAYHLCVYVNDVVRLWLDRNQLVYHCECGERSCLVCRQVYLGKNPAHHLNLEYSHTLGEPYLGFYVVPAREGEPWVGAFFTNTQMSGLPLVARTAANVDFNWQQFARPDTGLHYDYFAARWQTTVELVHGQYVFHVLVDDGARLRVNGRTLIDQWEKGSAREFTATYDVWGDAELAQIELDYYDEEMLAVVKLWWDAPPPTPTPTPTLTPGP